jgi:hypothetical protein
MSDELVLPVAIFPFPRSQLERDSRVARRRSRKESRHAFAAARIPGSFIVRPRLVTAQTPAPSSPVRRSLLGAFVPSEDGIRPRTSGHPPRAELPAAPQ